MNGLEKEYNGALKVNILPTTAEESQKQIASHGFQSHGMLIFDANKKLLTKMDGHFLKESQIREAVKTAIGR